MNIIKQIDSGTHKRYSTFQEWYDKLGEGKKWIAEYAQNTKGQIRSTEGVINANKSARASAIAYNNALKQQTLGAKASTIALDALKTAGNMLAVLVISKAISGIITMVQNAAHAAEEARQKAIETANSSNEEAKNLQELYIKYQQLSSIQGRTESQENEFKTALDDVTKALGDKQKALEGVTQGTAEYNEELEKATKQEFKEAWGNAKAGLSAAEDKINNTDISKWWEKGLGEMNWGFRAAGLHEFGKDSEENVKALEIFENKMQKWKVKNVDAYRPLIDSGMDYHATLAQRIAEFYNAIGGTIEELKQYEYMDLTDTKTFEKLSSIYNKVSESLEAYNEQKYNTLKYDYLWRNGVPTTIQDYNKMKDTILENSEASTEYKRVLEDILDTDFSELLSGFPDADAQSSKKLNPIESLWNADDFEDTRKKMQELAKESELTASDIKSLAKENEGLAALLEGSGILSLKKYRVLYRYYLSRQYL